MPMLETCKALYLIGILVFQGDLHMPMMVVISPSLILDTTVQSDLQSQSVLGFFHHLD